MKSGIQVQHMSQRVDRSGSLKRSTRDCRRLFSRPALVARAAKVAQVRFTPRRSLPGASFERPLSGDTKRPLVLQVPVVSGGAREGVSAAISLFCGTVRMEEALG